MIERNDDDLKDLLDLDSSDPALRERHRKALAARLGDLPPAFGKTRHAAVGLAGLVAALVCGSLSLTEPATIPGATRGLLALFALIGLGWTLFAGWALAKRRGDYAAERALAAKMAFGFTLAAIAGVSFAAALTGKEAAAAPLLAVGLALLILAAVLMTNARIDQAELAIRERILRLELRLLDRSGRGGES